ncbi:small-subunit processome [Microdochium bolleyi]|uniref:Small-subunit processome n=1 Tax=Microdochium bolleyi TaxID=196109 RepID=A0A136J317_9PEZI|nr:small-subunit processome [Microdochium bolleyi]
MSSSMRNAVQRRQHRERGQPLERAKYGLLEKHKDYSLRAADHKKKQATLKNLRAKAADKNEDEFYFGMMSRGGRARGPVRGATSSKGRKWDGIVDGDRGSLKGMDVEVSRLLKTQDLGYLRTMRNVASKDVRVLEERVIALGGSLEGLGVKRGGEDSDDEFAGLDDDDDDLDGERPRKKKKFVFSEDVEGREDMLRGDMAMQVDDDDDDDDDSAAGDVMSDEHDGDKTTTMANTTSQTKSKKPAPRTKEEEDALRTEQKVVLLGKLERRLEAARRKVTVLTRAEGKLELQRAQMAKTATAMGGVTKSGKKIKVRERKR